jgi:hypothetical protein
VKTRILVYGPAGWVETDGVRLRVQEVDGRFRVVELRMYGEDGITARSLREVSLGWVEAVINDPESREVLEASFEEDPPDLRPGVRMEWIYDLHKPKQQRRALRLRVPKSRPYEDVFYANVAERYARLAKEGEQPAKAIAEANDVPVGTVHGWIREARRRGFLPKGRQGTRG